MVAPIALAADLDFALGALNTRLAIESPGGQANSYYQGNGASVELRYRLYSHELKIYRYHRRPYGLDFTGACSFLYNRNIKQELGERYRQLSFGLGVDSWYKIFFLGFQYERNSVVVLTPPSRFDLYYNTYGPRFGLNFYLQKSIALRAGGVLNYGTIPTSATVMKNSTELRFFLLFSFNLVRTDPWWISQWLQQ
ncbi:MAG: hypothetical protein HYW49_06505 [Deltaproteobacteria bacterium]|nr:hypothetical protein [Deltaproteobacteria bacterium]